MDGDMKQMRVKEGMGEFHRVAMQRKAEQPILRITGHIGRRGIVHHQFWWVSLDEPPQLQDSIRRQRFCWRRSLLGVRAISLLECGMKSPGSR